MTSAAVIHARSGRGRAAGAVSKSTFIVAKKGDDVGELLSITLDEAELGRIGLGEVVDRRFVAFCAYIRSELSDGKYHESG